MLTKEKELESMRLYFNGKLEGKVLQEFETKLKEDKDFKQRIFMEKMVFEAANELFAPDNTLSQKGLQQAMQLSNELEEELFGTDNFSLEEFNVTVDVEAIYSLEELLSMFKPIEHFEPSNQRSTPNRSNTSLDSLVTIPFPDIDCPTYHLYFELREALPFELELTILDNQELILLKQVIAPQTTKFIVDLLFLEAKVGKYYWRLKANTRDRTIRRKYKSVVRSFFVAKGLNPY